MRETIGRLLEAHSKGVALAGAMGLPDALGDAHLCIKHPLYAHVRSLAISDGVRFSCGVESVLSKVYSVMPLLCLQSVLEEKLIPYRDNVCGLLALSEKQKTLPRGAQLLATSPAVNPLLHESAHFIAHTRGLFKAEDFLHLGSNTAWVAQLLANEAYANTVELFSLVNVRGPIDAAFLVMNSYMRFDAGRAMELRAAIREAGAVSTFVACALLFCARNMSDHRTLPTYARAAIEPGFEPGRTLGSCWLRRLAKIVQLEPRFTDTTTPLYLSLYLSEASSRRALATLRVNAGLYLQAARQPMLEAARMTLVPTVGSMGARRVRAFSPSNHERLSLTRD